MLSRKLLLFRPCWGCTGLCARPCPSHPGTCTPAGQAECVFSSWEQESPASPLHQSYFALLVQCRGGPQGPFFWKVKGEWREG